LVYCDSLNQFYQVITWIDRKRLWLMWSKSDFFCISLGSAVTFIRWSGQIYSRLVTSFLRSLCTKNYWNRFICDRVIPKIKKGDVFGTQCSLCVMGFEPVPLKVNEWINEWIICGADLPIGNKRPECFIDFRLAVTPSFFFRLQVMQSPHRRWTLYNEDIFQTYVIDLPSTHRTTQLAECYQLAAAARLLSIAFDSCQSADLCSRLQPCFKLDLASVRNTKQ